MALVEGRGGTGGRWRWHWWKVGDMGWLLVVMAVREKEEVVVVVVVMVVGEMVMTDAGDGGGNYGWMEGGVSGVSYNRK